ncbi:MAG: WbqC family protein [Cytophagales bacterium]|nr:WbqC family protein [Cytophagales bacterium]
MKAAIMQPYFAPYIGYFQLMNEVDTFVIYDDVNFIKKGWINRNNLLVNGQSNLFSIPLTNVSQNKKINETFISPEEKWKSNFLKKLQMAYKKAPYYESAFPTIEKIILHSEENLAKFIEFSLKEIATFLNINTKIILSSNIEKNNSLKGQEKILAICKKINANHYINPIGGMELYDKSIFLEENIILNFIQTGIIEYPQFKNEFVPWLSIIDMMMFNSQEEIQKLLTNFKLK